MFTLNQIREPCSSSVGLRMQIMNTGAPPPQACCTTRIPTKINGSQAGAGTIEIPFSDPAAPTSTHTSPLTDLQLLNTGAQIQFEANITTLGKYLREKLQAANIHSPNEAMIGDFILDLVHNVSRNVVTEEYTEEVVFIENLIVPVVSTYPNTLPPEVLITSNTYHKITKN